MPISPIANPVAIKASPVRLKSETMSEIRVIL